MKNGALKQLLDFKESLSRGSVLLPDAKTFNKILNQATAETGVSFDDLKLQQRDLSRLESVTFSPDSYVDILSTEQSDPYVERELFDEKLSAAIDRLRRIANDEEPH